MVAKKKGPEDTQEMSELDVDFMLAAEAENERLAALRKSIEDNPASGVDIATFGEVFARGEGVSGNGSGPVVDAVSAVSSSGADPAHPAAANEAQSAPAPVAANGSDRVRVVAVSLAQAKPTGVPWGSKFGERRFPWKVGECPPKPPWQTADLKASAGVAGGGGDTSAKQAGNNPSNPGGPQGSDNPGAGGEDPPPPPDNPRRQNLGGDEPPRGGRQMRFNRRAEILGGAFVAALALVLTFLFWWPGPRIARWWGTPTGQTVATAPAQTQQENNDALKAQIAALRREPGQLRDQLAGIKADLANAREKLEADRKAIDNKIAGLNKLAAAPCDCKKVAATPPPPAKRTASTSTSRRRHVAVDTRPPARSQVAQQQPAPPVALASQPPVAMPQTVSAPAGPAGPRAPEFYIEARKGADGGPVVPMVGFDSYFYDSGGREIKSWRRLTGIDGATPVFEAPPGTSYFQVVGQPDIGFLRPTRGRMLQVNPGQVDPKKGTARILFVLY